MSLVTFYTSESGFAIQKAVRVFVHGCCSDACEDAGVDRGFP